ncbi:MAG: ABC transporter permease [Chloroflexi bacterium]|nr:ABC transporter permease [Chloroflexota bacterium]
MHRFLHHRLATASLVVFVGLCLLSAGAPLFRPESLAYQPDLNALNSPPAWATRPFGGDEVGRDILARIIWGGRVTLSVAVTAVALSLVVGIVLGATAGYFGGWLDNLIMRLIDMLLAIPRLFILIIFTVFFGTSMLTIIVGIGGLTWMSLARVVRATCLSLREKEFIEAARTIGARDDRIILRHILPNTVPVVIVAATLGVARAILLEASLSYLGLGIQPPTPDWGAMLFGAQSYFTTAPWVAIFPGIFILITVLSISFIGDGLRDALDPRSKMM